MWGTVFALALVATVDPLRIGFTALVISRPRPMLSLLTFWLGGVSMGVATGLVVLFVLRDHALRIVRSVVSAAQTPTGGLLQLIGGTGALVVAIAVLTAVSMRRHASSTVAPTTHPGQEESSTGVPPRIAAIYARLPRPVQDLVEGGALWVAFVAGIMMATPIEYAFALAAVLVSGAGTASQVVAVVVFTSIAFVIAEIPLVSHLFAPARTQAVVLHVHDWVRAYRWHVISAVVAAVGVLLVINGASVI